MSMSVKRKVDFKEVAQAIADGAIVGWYQGKSESGNRALGNRSILADPRNPKIKDIINTKIKQERRLPSLCSICT
jgi:predicted NodU family carbamoyl transferase